ncbi:MAG: hypothetical protein C0421_07980 [Hyphomonas sp.]|uniref:hypothetical protein n=1 Tax=Hyphomonas sp. TaxID=87 RepID=UPI0025B7C7D4|nr:hypothetical protein [Hyphomonas sp.]MBA4338767.1 hypothetical protein [Hyphomonas sp.]
MIHHAKPEVLKAAAVTMPFVRFIEVRMSARHVQTVQSLRAEMAAEIARASVHEGGLADFVLGCAAQLNRVLPKLPALPTSQQAYIDELVADWRSRAQSVGEAAPACQSATGGAALFAAESACLAELIDAFAFVEDATAGLLAGEGLVLPAMTFCTAFDGALCAECSHIDQGAAFAEKIVLFLPERGFDKASFCAMPYVLMHELICHGAQGISGPCPRAAGGPDCPWSDGWMDCLAYETCLNYLFLGNANFAPWLESMAAAIAAAAQAHHAARYQSAGKLTALRELAAMARNEGKEAWHALRNVAAAIYRQLPGVTPYEAETKADALRRTFSLLYNAADVAHEERAALVTGLWTLLSGGNADRAASVAAIEGFVAAPNTGALHRAFAL